MNDKLKEIREAKLREVAALKARGLRELRDRPGFERQRISAVERFVSGAGTGIIAEFKRKSPSKGWINQHANVEQVTKAYAQHGATCISVLTDSEFFGGSLDDLDKASALNLPILRKDFMLDTAQMVEARAHGASLILLIAAFLSPAQTSELCDAAHAEGLEVLLELHETAELNYPLDKADLIGVNSRNLNTFQTDLNIAREMASLLPSGKPLIAESGIHQVETIVSLKNSGYKGFLIGEHFMSKPDPAIAFAEFTKQLKAQYED